MSPEELRTAAEETRADPRWATYWTGKNEGLYDDMTKQYGKEGAREVWTLACNMGGNGA